MIEILFAVLFTVLMTTLIWVNHCSNKTLDQRLDLRKRDPIENSEDHTKRIFDMKKVKYKTHLWYLITFRDPMPLYDFY